MGAYVLRVFRLPVLVVVDMKYWYHKAKFSSLFRDVAKVRYL